MPVMERGAVFSRELGVPNRGIGVGTVFVVGILKEGRQERQGTGECIQGIVDKVGMGVGE